jgi:hypothetical protein
MRGTDELLHCRTAFLLEGQVKAEHPERGCFFPCTIRSDNHLKVRFSTTLGEKPVVELSLV